jgi:hypothetical protein
MSKLFKAIFEPKQPLYHGLTGDEFGRLAQYNDERDHGIVHTRPYQELMAKLQFRYNEAMRVEVEASGGRIVSVDHLGPDASDCVAETSDGRSIYIRRTEVDQPGEHEGP